MERGNNNVTNTTIAITNCSRTNYLDNDKLNDSIGSELMETEEKSVFQKISEKPNFINRSLTASVHLLDSNGYNFVEKLPPKNSTKLKENAFTVKGKSLNLNYTRNESTEINSNRLNSNSFSRSTTSFLKKEDLKNTGNINLTLEKKTLNSLLKIKQEKLEELNNKYQNLLKKLADEKHKLNDNTSNLQKIKMNNTNIKKIMTILIKRSEEG